MSKIAKHISLSILSLASYAQVNTSNTLYKKFIYDLTGQITQFTTPFKREPTELIADSKTIEASQLLLGLENIYKAVDFSFNVYDKHALANMLFTANLNQKDNLVDREKFLDKVQGRTEIESFFSKNILDFIATPNKILYQHSFCLDPCTECLDFGITSLLISVLSNGLPLSLKNNPVLRPLINLGSTIVLPVWEVIKSTFSLKTALIQMPLLGKSFLSVLATKRKQQHLTSEHLHNIHTLVSLYEKYTDTTVNDPDVIALKKRGSKRSWFLQYLLASNDSLLLKNLESKIDLLEAMLIKVNELKPILAMKKLRRSKSALGAAVSWTDNQSFSFYGTDLYAPDTVFKNDAVPLTIDLRDDMALFSANGSGKSCLYRTITFNYLLSLLTGYVLAPTDKPCTITPGHIIIKGTPIKTDMHLQAKTNGENINIVENRKYLVILDEPAGERSVHEGSMRVQELMNYITQFRNTRILCATHNKTLFNICKEKYNHKEYFFETQIDNSLRYTRKLLAGQCDIWHNEDNILEFKRLFLGKNQKQNPLTISQKTLLNRLKLPTWHERTEKRYAADELCVLLENKDRETINCYNAAPSAINTLHTAIDNSLFPGIEPVGEGNEKYWYSAQFIDAIAKKYAYVQAIKIRGYCKPKREKSAISNAITVHALGSNREHSYTINVFEKDSLKIPNIHFNLLLPQLLKAVRNTKKNATDNLIFSVARLCFQLINLRNNKKIVSLSTLDSIASIVSIFLDNTVEYVSSRYAKFFDNRVQGPKYFYFDTLVELFEQYVNFDSLSKHLPVEEQDNLMRTLTTVRNWKKVRKYLIIYQFIVNPFSVAKAEKLIASQEYQECINAMTHFLLIARGLELLQQDTQSLNRKVIQSQITIAHSNDFFEEYAEYTISTNSFWALYPYCDEEPENNLSRGTKEAQVYHEIMAALELCKKTDREIVIYLDNFGMGTQYELQKSYLLDIIQAAHQYDRAKLCIVTFNTELEDELKEYSNTLSTQN